MALIDGTMVAASLRRDLAEKIALLADRPPRLDVILVGDYAPSVIYVQRKQQACVEVGITTHLHRFNPDCAESALLQTIYTLNADPTVDGILVQLPLPPHIDVNVIMMALSPKKDVDGFHPINRGKLMMGDMTALVPCTPLGICELLRHYDIMTEGKRVTIIGRSNLVGKPLAILLMQNSPYGNATVTVAHSYSNNIDHLCREADILVAALGKPHFIGPSMVKEGAIVIDVGTTAVAGTEESKGKRRLLGDVDYAAVQHKCQWITPVPGGVGPMTIAMLLSNTWQSYRLLKN